MRNLPKVLRNTVGRCYDWRKPTKSQEHTMSKNRRVTDRSKEAREALALVGANPARHRAVMALRASGATGAYDSRPRKQRTRLAAKRHAVAEAAA
jgi:hypothetical protein